MSSRISNKKIYLLWFIVSLTIALSIFSIFSIYNEYNKPPINKYIFSTETDRKHYKNGLKALTKELSTYNQQFTILSDTNHNNLNILEFIGNDATMKRFAELGYKNIFLEIRQELQKYADLIIAGKMTPEEYAQAKIDEYKKFGHKVFRDRSIFEAKIIQNASKYGLKVFCVEGQKTNLKAHSDVVQHTTDIEKLYYTTMKNMRIKEILKNPKELAGLLLNNIIGRVSIEDKLQQQVVSGYRALMNSNTPLSRIVLTQRKVILEERLLFDKALALNIKNNAKGDKSIILYGAAHGRNKCDLDNHLNAKRIEIFDNMLNAKFGWQNTQIRNNEIVASLVINKGRVFDISAINNNTIQGHQLPIKYQINLCPITKKRTDNDKR